MNRKGRLKNDDDPDVEQTCRGRHKRGQKKACKAPPFDAEEAQMEDRANTPSIQTRATRKTRHFRQCVRPHDKMAELPSKGGQQEFDAEEAPEEFNTMMCVPRRTATRSAASREIPTGVRGTSLLEEEKTEEVSHISYADGDYDSSPGAQRVRGFASTTRANDDSTVIVGGGGASGASVGHSSANVVATAQLVEDPVVAAEVGTDQSGELKERLDEVVTSRRRLVQIGLCMVLSLVAVVVGLVTLFIVIWESGDGINSSAAAQTTAGNPSLPTTSPTSPPAMGQPLLAPTPDPKPTTTAPTTSLQKSWIQLIQSKMPSITFENSTSPEGKALAWLVEDSYTISLDNDDRIVQRFALAVLYYSTDGPTQWQSETRNAWLQPSTECDWVESDGVVGCDNSEDVVNTLDLSDDGLFGSIPKELGLLSAMTWLNLSTNIDISGPLPTELGNLSNLVELYISSTRISGPLPTELGNLSNLQFLSLSNTDISGSLPTELGNLSNLEWLSLVNTNISGSLPTELGNLSNVHGLYLYFSSISGPLPTELGKLSNLQRLELYNTNISGPLPMELGNLSNLQQLHLYNTNISGPLPTELAKLSNLEWLYLYLSNIYGPLPTELGNLSNLQFLKLDNTDLSGPLPTKLGNLSNLIGLHLYNSNISGPLPTELGSLSKLTWLSLSNTNISGPLPTELGNLLNLIGLSMYNTSISGPLPTELGNLSKLINLYLYNTSLSGSIPSNLCGNLISALIDCGEIKCDCCIDPDRVHYC